MKIVYNGEIICTDAFDLENVRGGISFDNDSVSTLYAIKYRLNGKIGKEYPEVVFLTIMSSAELRKITATLSNNSGKSIYADVFMYATEKHNFLCVLLNEIGDVLRSHVFWKKRNDGEY